MKRTWHLMFDKNQYKFEDIKKLSDFFIENQNFIGFPLISVRNFINTESLIYLDVLFEQNVSDIDLNIQTIQQMAKYIYFQLITLNKLKDDVDKYNDDKDKYLYYQIMQKTLDQLKINISLYQNRNIDIIFWSSKNYF